MAPMLRNAPKSYRLCILYEFQLGRSIEEAFKNFCRDTKKDHFYYGEFAYWFNRFANGNVDLDDDKERKSISDLPLEILGEIVGKLDTKSQLRTRKVSRFLRCAVDNKKIKYGPKSILIDDSSITIEFDDNFVNYNKYGDECLLKYGSSKTSCLNRKVLNGNFLDIAFVDLKIAINNPKLQLEFLKFRVKEEAELQAEKVVKFFKSLESPLQVKSLVFHWHYGLECVLPIVSKLKSGTLENVNFGHMMPGLNMSLLAKMEQWKHAKEFVSTNPIKIEINKLLHFNRCDIHVESSISAQDIVQLRNVILSSPDFEYCRLKWHPARSTIDEIGNVLGIPVVRRAISPGVGLWREPFVPRWEESTISHRQPIPGTNEFLDFNIDPSELHIKRTE